MQPEFWHKRWASDQIGFHLAQVNPYLQSLWPSLAVAQGAQVLVPLCGKSLDLMWLANRGHRVLGVELSEKAVEGFFHEQGLAPTVTQQGAFKVYQDGSIQLWCGDVFALRAEDVAGVAGFYDRAALIALPPEMRERYAVHLRTILPQGCDGLLITMDYDQALIEGPPFAVLDEEVERLLAARWQVAVQGQRDILGESGKFLQAGVPRLEERAYRLGDFHTAG
ncbi:MAG: thiopurine S-methyltransferase [Candidatus Pseudomonas colombiensis]|jgi:thiopurine S-methyltransferase|nr:MAG: thiopurine S-methyltransferase [Pseudomonas sp.]